MDYDPIKKRLGNFFSKSSLLRRVFYCLLDLLLLRAWHVKRELKRLKEKDFSGEINILDAGSGFGQYTYRMSRLFPKAFIKGVDVKQEQIDDCNRFFASIHLGNKISFEYGDLTKLNEPEKYNLILCVDVMEHIAEDELVFANFHQSLRKNGILLISTPSDQGGSDSEERNGDSIHGFIGEHVRDGYGIQEIREKLGRAGFSEVEAIYVYGTPGSLSWRLSMKYPILMLGKSRMFFIILPFYYLIVFPFCAVLNLMDLKMNHKTGTGLLVKAWK
jgi:SAM-dependent methyltransferase